jgi:endonuclease YncB( thermonuclease family)
MLRAIVLALIGSVSLAAIYMMSGRDHFAPPQPMLAESVQAPRPAKPVAAPAPDLTDLRPAVAPAPSPPETAGRDVRDVTPLDMTTGPRVTGALTRLAPPPKPAPAAVPASPKPRTERLLRPTVEAAGLVVSGKRAIRLAGIQAPGPDQTCGEGASAWPCGRMARAALRRFVRGRAVECDIPAGADTIPDPARCVVAGVDLSGWLVAQGWARHDSDSYAALETAARDGRRGMWSTARPGTQPAVTATRGPAARAPESAPPMSSRVSGIP